MPVFSRLLSSIARPSAQSIVTKTFNRFSHGRNMHIEPSSFNLRKVLDMIHFYTSIGLMTSLPIVIWFNLTQAPAELADIPEDYEPEYWEYEKHPIRRFLAKHLYGDPRIQYEKELAEHYLDREEEFILRFKKRVENVIRVRQDSASWFYVPIEMAPVRIMLEDRKRFDESGIIKAPEFGYHLSQPDPAPDFPGLEEEKKLLSRNFIEK